MKTFTCPACSNRFAADSVFAARGVKCPRCSLGFVPDPRADHRRQIFVWTIVAAAAVLCVGIMAAMGLAQYLVPLGMIVGVVLFYFIPTIVGRNKHNATAIFVLNLVAGWTFAGWVVALVWACTKDRPAAGQIHTSRPSI